MFILGWIPKGRAMTSAMSPSWSLVISSAQRQNLRLGGVASGHRPQHQEGVVSFIGLPWP
jgi:hypothetical protein